MLTTVKWIVLFLLLNILTAVDFCFDDETERRKNNELRYIEENKKNN